MSVCFAVVVFKPSDFPVIKRMELTEVLHSAYIS